MPISSGRVLLYLAYSAETGSNHTLAARPHGASVGIQLDLFPTDKPDAVIFTNPKRTDFEQILEMIRRFTVKNILDLRDLPSLSFERISRERFLDAMTTCRVEYRPLQSILGKQFQVDTISDFFHAVHENAEPSWNTILKNCIEPLIRGGPTIVFTEAPPETDEVAHEFAVSLARSNIHFSQVFANVQ
jgi:hypothetical protein